MHTLEPCFHHTADNSEPAQFQRDLNKAQITFWLDQVPDPEEDFHTQIDVLAAAMNISKAEARDGLRVGALLRRFPKLRACIQSHWHVNLKRLSTIERQVMAVDSRFDPDIDDYLENYLTPSIPDQVLSQPATIAKHLRNFIQRLDPDAAQQPKEQAQRVASFKRLHNGFTRFSARVTDLEAEWLRRAIKKHLGSEIELIDAFFDLLRSKVRTKVVMNEFIDPEGLIHMLGVGVLDSNTAKQWPPDNVVHLDVKQESSYKPSPELRATVQILDGTCRYPGCTTPATECELDHVINFDEGGSTSVDNLVCLCKFHHNTKTSQRVHYTLDSSRITTWHFRNGTVKRTTPNHGIPMFGQTWSQHEHKRVVYRRSGS